ncbi:MAG: aminoglycoside phosphotransferase family protein, partial [Candidatus Omnitrophica bacterium]|nr:aminoglycoside phosphotransferase family protein [Candidatus Omnitrophota bacterium]
MKRFARSGGSFLSVGVGVLVFVLTQILPSSVWGGGAGRVPDQAPSPAALRAPATPEAAGLEELRREIRGSAVPTGLEELAPAQVLGRLQPLLDHWRTHGAAQVLALDVDGVATQQDGNVTPEMASVLEGFAAAVPSGKAKAALLLLTDISPGQLRDRVTGLLPEGAQSRTREFPLSGGEYVNHIIPEQAIGVIDGWVVRVSGKKEAKEGKETVLRLKAKQAEHSAGQISDESLTHGFDVNRTGFTSGSIVGIDIELNKDWLTEVTKANQGVDPRDQWVAELKAELKKAGVPESVAENIHKAGSGSITWTPPKGEALIRWTKEQGIDPEKTVLVDDSASNFRDFPNVTGWPGLLIYLGKHNEELARTAPNVIQIARPGEEKPNGPEVARVIVQTAQGVHQLFGEGLAHAKDQEILNLLDTYDALHQIFRENLGLGFSEVVTLIQRHAEANGRSFSQEVSGALDVPDDQLPKDEEFAAILKEAEALFDDGGNSGRLSREASRAARAVAISEAPVDDDGGNYGAWRSLVTRRLGAFAVTLAGDYANKRGVETSLAVRQAMSDRLPEKDKKAGWPKGTTVRSLLLAEIANAFTSFKLQYPDVNLVTSQDPRFQKSLVWSLATLISAHRILSGAFTEEGLLKEKVLSKASGQNALGVAIALRSGFLDLKAKATHPERLKRAVLLWNRALGLGPEAGLVIPASLDGVRLHFVYEDDLTQLKQAQVVEGEAGVAKEIKVGKTAVPPEDFFTVTKTPGGQLILTDGSNRVLAWDAGEKAFMARNPDGLTVNRFEAIPDGTRQTMLDRLGEVPSLTIIRGEDYASEVDTVYEGTRVLVWGAEYPADRQPEISPLTEEVQEAILEGQTGIKTVALGPGSEGTSTAPYFWRPGKVRFLEELARRRKAGQAVPRVVFIFNPSETNDSYGLGPVGIIRNYERIFSQILGRQVPFEELFPEVVLFDHTDPWILARNPAVAKEMFPDKPLATSLPEVDYLRILGPTEEERKAGKRHGLRERNRQPMPLTAETRQELVSRFGEANLHIGPFADVRGIVESSRGKIERSAQVLAFTHRMWPVLFPWRAAELLPQAVREEARIYQEKHGAPPAPAALAEFLSKVGYQANEGQVAVLMARQAGLEEVTPVSDPKEHAAVVEAFNAFEAGFTAGAETLVESMVLGRINATYYLTGPDGKKFLVQRINPIFDAAAIDHNLQLLMKSQAMARAQGALPSHWKDVHYYQVKEKPDHVVRYDEEKNAWRVMEFIPGTRVFDSFKEVPAEHRFQVARSIGETIATFRKMLEFIPASQWKEPLPRFHDHRYHLEYLEKILRGEEIPLSLSRAADPPRVKLQPGVLEGPYRARIETLRKEIEERKKLIEALDGLDSVPAHNDLKINNFLFPQDAAGGLHVVALVDLDTVQPGAELDDLGDAIRSAANPAGEEPASISEVRIDKEIVQGIMEGFLAKISEYYGPEKAAKLRGLAYQAGEVYYLELAMRFFADFLVGNRYFRGIKDEASNLYRAEVQMAALKALEAASATGLEEAATVTWREQSNLLPPAASLTPSIGVIAGSRGLAYGVALSRLSASDGSPLPVVFVVESGLEEDFLKELGFTDG